MSIWDIVVLAILALAALLGFFKGLYKALLRLVEVILAVGLSVLAAMCMVWFGLADLDAIMAGGDLMESGALFMAGAFLVMFILSVIVLDYVLNRIIYGKRSFKNRMIDRCLGLVVNTLLWVAILWAVFAMLGVLEGTEYDLYVSMMTDSVIMPFFVDFNPFKGLFMELGDNGFRKTLVEILNMVWPNFEYLG